MPPRNSRSAMRAAMPPSGGADRNILRTDRDAGAAGLRRRSSAARSRRRRSGRPASIVPSIRLAVPRKVATKRLAGRSYSSIGVPICWMRPWSSTAMLSAIGVGVLLVVGDVDRGDAELALQLPQLDAHLDPQPGIEVRQRLVEQQHLRLDHDRARERDALLLAAGQLRRPAVGEGGEPDQVERVRDLALDLGARELAALEAEGDVLARRSCAATARSSGTPCRRCGSTAAAASRRARRSGCGRRSACRSRRSGAAAWSCRSRTARGTRRTARARPRARCPPAPASRRSRRSRARCVTPRAIRMLRDLRPRSRSATR